MNHLLQYRFLIPISNSVEVTVGEETSPISNCLIDLVIPANLIVPDLAPKLYSNSAPMPLTNNPVELLLSAINIKRY